MHDYNRKKLHTFVLQNISDAELCTNLNTRHIAWIKKRHGRLTLVGSIVAFYSILTWFVIDADRP